LAALRLRPALQKFFGSFFQKRTAFFKISPYILSMSDTEFDQSLVTAAFTMGADEGWRLVSAAGAARRAGLALVLARERFPTRASILMKFGEFADQHALTGAMLDGTVRDRLFDLLMRRFDYLQTHRGGVLALLKVLPLEPVLGLLLARVTVSSMGWMLEGAGVSGEGVRGEIAKRGLALVWAMGMRAWLNDDSADLTGTMAAVDTALNRADAIAARFEKAPAMADPAGDVPFEMPADPLPMHAPPGPAAPPNPDLPFPEDPSAVA
jgi:hypothetical protein